MTFGDLPPEILVGFDELRRVRAMTQSVVLTSAAARNLIMEVKAIGLDHDDGVRLAFRAVALGNADYRNGCG